MTIVFYSYGGERNRVDKTGYLSVVNTVNGTLRDESSLTKFSVMIETDDFESIGNYAYISQFKRYYFIDDIVCVRNGLWEVFMSVDVLMTYKNGLLKQSAFIDRNEFDYNNLIVDSKRVIEQGYDVTTYLVENYIFNPDEKGIYLLTGLGVGATER